MSIVRRVAAWFDGPRRIVAIVALCGAAAIMLSSGPDPASSTWVGVPDMRTVVTILLMTLMAIGLILRLLTLGGPSRQSGRRGRRRSLWPLWAAAGIAVVFALFIDPEPGEEAPVEGAVEVATGDAARVGPESDDAPTDGTDDVSASDIAVLAAVAATAIGIAVWSRSRSAQLQNAMGEELPPLADDLAPAVDRALDGLLSSRDPRTAILAAYASVEAVLAARGDERRESETPAEHLSRVLAGLPVDGTPLIQLGELYEVARFSRREMTAADRQRAIDLLDVARDRLRRPAVTP